MATKSILKNVKIKDRRSIRRLVDALENAGGKHAQEVETTCSFSDASREEIHKMFEGKK